MNPMSPPCPTGCGRTCGIHTLCDTCWNLLPVPAQLALCMIHAGSAALHQQLFDQLADGVPVTGIEIGSGPTPPPPREETQLSLFDTA